MPVITIARQSGAGGATIGSMVARHIKADLLDRPLVAEVARRLELPMTEVEAADEQPESLLDRLLLALGKSSPEPIFLASEVGWAPPFADSTDDPRRAVLEVTQQVIREAARSNNVVIVGRGGAYILSELDGALHVYIRAAEGNRLNTLIASFALTEEEARRRIKETDANRTAYIRQVYGKDWADPSNYALVIDTSRVGYDRAVNSILAALPDRPSPPEVATRST